MSTTIRPAGTGGAPPPKIDTSAPKAPVKTEAKAPVKAPEVKPKEPENKFLKGPEAKKYNAEFVKNIDDRLKNAGVPDDVRQRTVDRFKSLEKVKGKGADFAQQKLTQEAQLLDKALAGPNADRAVVAFDKINAVAASDKTAAARLTPEIKEALVNGVANRRTADDVGQEGILGVKQAEEAAKAIATMPKAQYDQLAAALKDAGKSNAPSPRADAGAEQALILKAVAARSTRLADNPADNLAVQNGQAKETEASRAMKEITDFSADVRGLPRDELINTTTAIDVSSANTSKTDAYKLRDAGNDTTTNNDGLYQRFEDTCGPTTSQLMLSEADPVFARKVHKEGIGNADPNASLAQQQKTTLEKQRFFDANDKEIQATPAQLQAYNTNGTLPPGATWADKGSTSSRRGDQAREHLNTKMNEMGLPEFAQKAVNKKIAGQELGWIEKIVADTSLKRIQNNDSGHPTTEEQGWIKNEGTNNNAGMMLHPALNDITGPSTHIDYKPNWVGNTGPNDTHLATVDSKLKAGQDVPIRVNGNSGPGGHFMMISDVRGTGDDRKYLVSDPYSGRTAWVDRKELINNNDPWIQNKFGMGWNKVSHFYTE